MFEDTTGRDLSQFKRWYTQAGTPRVTVSEDWDGAGTFTLTFRQHNPATPGQPVKDPKVLPIAVGLLNPNGDEVVPTVVLEMTQAEQSFTFDGLASRPVPSILRGFSAPVVLDRQSSPEERAFLLAHDTDPFNRWEAGRALAKDVLTRMTTQAAQPAPDWLDALARVTFDDALDPAFRALALRLPGEDDMAQTLHAAGHVPDPAALHTGRRRMAQALAERLAVGLPGLIASLAEPGPFSPDARAAGRRALRGAALSLVSRTDDGRAAEAAFAAADNMTEELGAITCLLDIGRGQAEVAAFGRRWAGDRNVTDKWFAVQVAHAAPDALAEVTATLTAHPAFDWKTPNRFRAVIGALAGNHAGFHHASGSGYGLLSDWLIRLDPVNPQTAARMSTAFEVWQRYDAGRQAMIRAALSRILSTPGLSRDVAEMVARMLGD